MMFCFFYFHAITLLQTKILNTDIENAKNRKFHFDHWPWPILIRVNDSSTCHQTSNIHVLLNIQMFDVRMFVCSLIFECYVRKFRNSRIFACFLIQMFEVRMFANFQIVHQTWTNIRTSNKNVQYSLALGRKSI